MKAEIKRLGRQFVIDIDGRTLSPVAYMSYAPLKENFDAMKKSGVKLFMFPIYANDEGINMESGLRPFCDNFFKGYGEYDFTAVDKVLAELFCDGTEDVYVIPRVCIEPPIWWQRMHPEEVSRDSRGEAQRESFASEVWRRDMTVALHALIDHIESSPYAGHVIGYHVAAGGTEEWTYQCRYNPQFYDYSEVNLRSYRRFLLKRYGTLEGISAAHKRTYADLESVAFPHPVERQYCESGYLRDPDTERAVLDYYDYHNEIVADAICYFCRDVKEYTRGERLVGVFYGYVFLMPQNYKGLHALGKIISSPYIDFISTTNSGKHWHHSSAVESVRMHGKLWMCEADIRTCFSTGMGKNLAHAMPDNDFYDGEVWRGPSDVKGSVDMLTQALARAAATPAGIWWFDMFGGWFDDPRMLSVIEKSVSVLSEEKRTLFESEVAFIVDEGGHKYSSLDNKRLPAATWELLDAMDLAGFPYDNYLLSDIKDPAFPADKYRLFIFLAAPNPSDEELSAVEKKLKRDGKTLLFLGTSGAYSRRFCDFSLTVTQNPEEKRAVFDGEIFPKSTLPAPELHYDGGYVLSKFEDGTPAVVWKRCDGYHSVISLPFAISSGLLRHVAHLSGVHLYNRTGDAVFVGGEYIGIRASESGYRRACLPYSDMRAFDALTGERVSVNDRFIDLKLEKGDIRLLRLEADEIKP